MAVSLFAAALVDLLLDFGLFGPAAAAVLFALSLASLLYLVRSPSRAGWAPVALLAGASFAFGIRALGDEASPLRPPSLSFHEARDRDARSRAGAAKSRFRQLTGAALQAARSLASEPLLEEAVVARDPARVSRAFEILEAQPLPRAHAVGTPGASLFDDSLRPVAWAGSSDRNFYDRCYLNAHDRTGDLFLITGLGFYPNLGTKDAFVLLSREVEGRREQTAVHLSDAADPRGADRMAQEVGNYRIEVTEPMRKLRIVMEETEGLALDLSWEGTFDVVQELPHVMRQGSGTTLDAQRFAQIGTWEGVISVDGTDIAVTPDRWVGTRDRSWGIRPVGEAAPAGKPADPAFDGMWWLYVPIAFDDFAVVMIIQEEPDGFRSLNDCTRIWRDGRVEQLGWPRVTTRYRSGTRIATGATIEATRPDGTPVIFEVESKLPVPIHVGGGYGGDSDWIHGTWKGDAFTERLTYDMTDPAIVGRAGFGVIDHVGRAVCTQGNGAPAEGWGLFEHGALGRHDPSGFADWLSVAP